MSGAIKLPDFRRIDAATAKLDDRLQATASDRPLPHWREVEVCDLDHAELPPQRWIWEGYIPAREVTLLGAHGGTGKSYIALMMAVSVALGLPLFGVGTEPGPVLFYSAEDDSDTVRRRLQFILRTLSVPAELLRGRLRILDATSGNPELFGEYFDEQEGRKRFGPTPAALALQKALAAAAGALLIVDNASDTYGGNEIVRSEVRAFVRMLKNTACEVGGAVCLLAHVDKGTSRGDRAGTEGYSGSTAWHNSVRSRLYLSREKGGGSLVLEHQKSNHGPMREPLRLEWPRDGLPGVEVGPSGMVQALDERNTSKALLRLIHEFTERGESVSTATAGPGHAGKLLRKEPAFPPRLSDADLHDALRQAQRKGWLDRELYRKANRHPGERWIVTAAGCSAAGLAPVAPVAPVPAIDADGADGATAAPVAPVLALGGVGGVRRTEPAHGTDAEPA